jgi:DnaK suppressor protein
MDIIDEAQRIEIEFQEKAIEATRKRILLLCDEKPLVVNGVRECISCGEAIPKARIKANPDAVRCVVCQNARDKVQGRI